MRDAKTHGKQEPKERTANRVTLQAVNTELARRKYAVTLVKASGYFYFEGKEPATWLDRTVRVVRISDLSLEAWIAEYENLKKRNQEMLTKAQSSKPAKE